VQELLERSGVGTFAEFVAARSGRLLRVAYMLTRDWALAEDLLQTSLAKAWSAWRRIEGDPEPYVRKILVNTYTTWWRRRWHSERPTDVLPERPGTDEHRTIDERDQILRALGRLPRQQRAVLVLRYYEDLSEVEIAEALGISPGTVKSHAVKGLANLRLDASLAAAHLSSDEPEPAGTARLAAVTERIQQRRRRRTAAIVAACAVVLAVILGYAINPAHRSAPHPATTPSPHLINGFEEYQRGKHIVTAGSVSTARPTATLTWLATTSDVAFFVHCPHMKREVTVWLEFSIGSDLLMKTSCSGFLTPNSPGGNVSLPELRAGSRVEVTVRIAYAYASMPDDFVADIGVGEAVPLAQYSFPAAPPSLPPLFSNGVDLRAGSIALRPGPDALQPVSVDLVWGDWEFYSTLDAPGEIVLSVNGITILTYTKWDYAWVTGLGIDSTSAGGFLRSLNLHRGDHVTLTVTPIRVGHSWAVWAAPPLGG
jgi:RNA polymerase sigma-70 factor (sigma-E family)